MQGRLTAEINHIEQRQQRTYAFPTLRCTFADRSLAPDIAIFQWNNIPTDENGEIQNRFNLAPDWTIEILSPEQSPPRVIEKILFSLQHGWLIDPDDTSVTVFHPDKLAEFKERDDRLPVLSSPSMEMRFCG